MKRYLTIIIIIILFASESHAQDALAKLEYQDAETAYQNDNYSKALEHLEATKKLLGSTNATIMYLEISAKDKLLNTNNTSSYTHESLKQLCNDNNFSLITFYFDVTKSIYPAVGGINETQYVEFIIKAGNQSGMSNINKEELMYQALTEAATEVKTSVDTHIKKIIEKHNLKRSTNNSSEIDLIEKLVSLDKLSKKYLKNFQNSAPLDKTKVVYEIQQKLQPRVIESDAIIQGLKAIKAKQYTNAIILLEKACKAGNEFGCMKREEAYLWDQITNHKDEIIQNLVNNMVLVEGGTFVMGMERYDNDNKTPHSVTLTDFYINKYEVTRLEWMAVMEEVETDGNNKCYDCPKVSSRYEILTFIDKLNEKTGISFILPTEAQWEFAATGGNESEGFEFAGSNNKEEVYVIMYLNGKGITSVGSKKPNELGLYDMNGNVNDMCLDFYDGDFYKKSKNSINPICNQIKNWDKKKYELDSKGYIKGVDKTLYGKFKFSIRGTTKSKVRLKTEEAIKSVIGFRLAENQ